MSLEQYLKSALEGKSPTTCAFWYGKFLQALEQEREESELENLTTGLRTKFVLEKTLQEHQDDAKHALCVHQTCLSPSVHPLVTAVPSSAHNLPNCVGEVEGVPLLNWDAVGDILVMTDNWQSIGDKL